MPDVVGALMEPWSQPLLRLSLVEISLIGIAAGVLGCWVIFYELAYGAESLAHAMFPGLVVAALTGVPLIAGAVCGVALATAGIAAAGRVRGVGRDTAVAVVVTTLFAAGVLAGLSPATPAGLGELLFGDLLAVSRSDVAVAGALAVAVLGACWLLHWQLLAVGFDRSAAQATGASRRLADAALLLLLGAVIVVAVQALGNLLVVAVLVGPAATARLLTRRMPAAMLLAGAIAVACGAAGLYLSYYAGLAAGASVAAAAVAAYVLALAATTRGPRLRISPA
jgi:ABC-type Mn2+/Zn2+ transport system permease subunit